MAHRFAEIAFTDSVREVQQALGSRTGYAAMDEGTDSNRVLSAREADFIKARDSFYMASVSETGWPYVQHRGGPRGFARVLDERTLGFADFRGNRQYVSVGNLRKDDRVALFFMDYPNRARLKVLGRVRLIGADERELMAAIESPGYRAPVERGFLIHVEAFDWNCPQHITPRYTESEFEALMAPLVEENRVLKAARNDAAAPAAAFGDGPLELIISGVRQLTPRIRAYELRDPNGGALPLVEAGAHLEVPVRLTDGKTVIRHYSICSNPARRDAYEIAVLREEEGSGGSRAVHELFAIGMRLRCELPQNRFRLHPDARPAVLIAGGIGITPIKAMAQELAARGNDMHLHYAGRSGSEMAFRYWLLRAFADVVTIYRAADGERMNIERILSTAPNDALFYVCGPSRLIDAVVGAATALNIDPERIRVEHFIIDVSPGSRPIEVELRRSGKRLRVAADQSILDAMLEAGIDAPFSCRVGTCKTCRVKVLAGEPEHRDSALSVVEREDDGLICPCVSRARGDYLTLDI
ncbi:MAG: pyridoxamine 5'-phosphate oxidase [Proteobacteria bacterium]|nr:MAG: pyridoxamine 5'-phosphate oxidase [Pseudomonadota bacterium]